MKALSQDSPDLASPAFASAMSSPTSGHDAPAAQSEAEPQPQESEVAGAVFNPFGTAMVVHPDRPVPSASLTGETPWHAPLAIIIAVAVIIGLLVRRILD